MPSQQTTTLTERGSATDELSAAELLTAVKDARRAADAEEARVLAFAAQWADLHPPESIHHAAGFHTPGLEEEEPLAGPGTPLVAEFCLAELGSVLGMSTTAAKRLVGNALELRHRLPRLWARVQRGQVPAWRARLVAEATSHACPALSAEAAGWVDDQVAAYAAKIGPAQLDRLVAEAIKRYSPDPLPDDPDDPDDPPCRDPRHVTIDSQQLHWAGTLRIEAELDLPDALDLDHTLAQRAAQLKALGSEDSLDARRAKALGDLARTQTSLDLEVGGRVAREERAEVGGRVAREEQVEVGGRVAASAASGVSRPSRPSTPPGELPAARQLVLYLHLSADAVNALHTDTPDGLVVDPLARLDNGQRLVLLDQIKTWAADTLTDVTVKPVIDLGEELTTDAYTPTARQREQVTLRDRYCVHPYCTRPARGCDVDHVEPYDHDATAKGRPQPGPTTTSNLAVVCRRHHRLKTHGRWRVQALASGVFLWTTPHGHRFLRDRTGTTALPDDTGTAGGAAGDPDPPPRR